MIRNVTKVIRKAKKLVCKGEYSFQQDQIAELIVFKLRNGFENNLLSNVKATQMVVMLMKDSSDASLISPNVMAYRKSCFHG